MQLRQVLMSDFVVLRYTYYGDNFLTKSEHNANIYFIWWNCIESLVNELSLAGKFPLFRVIRSSLELYLAIVVLCVALQLKEIRPRVSAWSSWFLQVQFLFLESDEFNSFENFSFAIIKRVSNFHDAALSLMSWTVSQEVCITAVHYESATRTHTHMHTHTQTVCDECI